MIDWSSTKRKLVCNSTAEAVYISSFGRVPQALFHGCLTEELFDMKTWPIEHSVDNKAVFDTSSSKCPKMITSRGYS